MSEVVYPLLQMIHRRYSAPSATVDNKFSIKSNAMREILSNVFNLLDSSTLKPE